MHMADALLSPVVGGAMCAISAGAIGYSAAHLKKYGLEQEKIPVMGVMGAFVFAAQMINFTIPGTGSSGHIGGAILLAAVLGEAPAFLTISAVLIIQALIFADGGLLALGCNIFNMGLIPCFLAYPLIFKPLLGRKITGKRLAAASMTAVVLGLQLGAFCVVLETTMSGITKLPFSTFVLLMQPIHLAIGVVEGIITASVLLFVTRMEPGILAAGHPSYEKRHSMKQVVAVLAVLTVVTGGCLSVFASSNPDGLEWSIAKTTGEEELTASGGVFDTSKAVQKKSALMPDYQYKNSSEAAGGTSVAGILGSVITFGVAAGAGLLIRKRNYKVRRQR